MDRPDIETVAGWYDGCASGYDERHRKGDRKYRIIERKLQALLDAGRVLDLGCGTGRLLRGRSQERVVGMDLSIEMLRLAKASSSSLIQGDAHRLPFGDNSFDAVVAAQGVIRYLRWPELFGEIYRVLKPLGRVAVHHFGVGQRVSDLVRGRTTQPDPMDLEDLQHLVAPARAAGLRLAEVERFRSSRFYPYALKIPAYLSDAWWNHCVVHFEKT